MSKRFIENLLNPYQVPGIQYIIIESNPDRLRLIVVAYPRPALSATKWTNHAPISFDQQSQASQDRVMQI